MLRPMDAPRRCLLPLGTDWLFRRARPRPGRTDGKAIRSVTGARILLSLAGRRPRRIWHCLIVRRAGPVRRAGRIAAGGTATGIEIVLRLIGGRRRRRCVRAGPARAGRRVTGRARSSRTRPGSSRRATRGRASTRGSSAARGTGASSASSTSRALRIDAGGGRPGSCQGAGHIYIPPQRGDALPSSHFHWLRPAVAPATIFRRKSARLRQLPATSEIPVPARPRRRARRSGPSSSRRRRAPICLPTSLKPSSSLKADTTRL